VHEWEKWDLPHHSVLLDPKHSAMHRDQAGVWGGWLWGLHGDGIPLWP